MAKKNIQGIDKENFRELLDNIGFKLEDGIGEVYTKMYPEHNGYTIKIDFEKETINYRGTSGNGITVVRDTTSNFSYDENAVVLECVDRLLTLGYKPKDITLEKSFPNGHDATYLDIFVMEDNKSYLMIECKTFGKSYQNELKNMGLLKRDGQPKGQLFAYYSAEQVHTKLLCLYASRYIGGMIERENDIIETKEEWAKLGNIREIFDNWNKNFNNKGIFENECLPYNYQNTGLTRGELKPLTQDSATTIFNQFLEILRHNAVSDKPNAFNKMLNLFVCKIMDEDKQDSEELAFQWKENSDYNTLMSNLEELYKQGMNQFLGIDVTDYSENELNAAIVKLDDKDKSVVISMLQKLRLQKGSEFAFTEVYNEESFLINAKIVREIVELLQKWQFRYGHKQQFLGVFFEQLLATSIKQESGQFFTPLPIARFIVSSLPLKELTYQKLHDNNTKELLPVAIDYACGSGHFLTEYMDIEQMIINEYDVDEIGLSNSARKNLLRWQKNSEDRLSGEFEWASEHVYGIEKDYRLVKTTKISTFLNGDGDANIIHADGLDKFTSNKYSGLLKLKNSSKGQNEHFDIVIANPPYSVNAFKQTLNADNSDFTLYDLISDKNDDIECLFVERTAQLLHAGKYSGYAAIILPSSVFSSNIDILHIETRNIILRNFHICAMVRMSAKVFAKTPTETIILFMKKREYIDYVSIQNMVATFFKNGSDFSYAGNTCVIQSYLNECCSELSIEMYKKYLNGMVEEEHIYTDMVLRTFERDVLANLKKNKAYQSLSEKEKKEFIVAKKKEYIISLERERIEDYLLVFTDTILIADSLEGDEGQDFIGYKFSERRTKTGIRDRKDGDAVSTSKLFNENDLWEDSQKLNYHINKACKGEKTVIPASLAEHAEWQKGIQLFNWNVPFDNRINVRLSDAKKERPIIDGYKTIEFGVLTDSYSGDTALSQEYIGNHRGDYPVLSAKTQGDAIKGHIDTWKYDMECVQITTNGVNSGTVIFREKQKFSIGADTRVYTLKKEFIDTVSLKYLSYAMKVELARGGYSWKKKSGKSIINDTVIHIPVNDKGEYDTLEQNRIVAEIEKKEQEIREKENEIKEKDESVMRKFDELFGDISLNDKGWKSERVLQKKNLKNGLNYSYDENGVRIRSLGVGDFENKYSINNTDDLDEISLNQMPPEEYLLKDNDIVFVRSNGNKELVGRSVIIKTGKEPVSFSGFCIRYRNDNEEIDPVYLLYVLKTEFFRKLLRGNGSNIKNLNQDILSALSIPVPPMPLQEKFLEFVYKTELDKKSIEEEIENMQNELNKIQERYF
ncbi:MAG: N-6 DNA methylase [Lachnospiraceae bacterium]|nr:N-6 DNA methylase [Lachnospiraceae bacterium]